MDSKTRDLLKSYSKEVHGANDSMLVRETPFRFLQNLISSHRHLRQLNSDNTCRRMKWNRLQTFIAKRFLGL